MDKLTKKHILFIIALILTIILIPLNYNNTKLLFIPYPLRITEIVLATGVFGIFLYFSKLENTKEDILKTGTILLFAAFSCYKIIYFYTANITRIPLLTALCFILAFFGIFMSLFIFFKIVFNDKNKAVILSLIWILALSVRLYHPNAVPSYIGGFSFVGITVLTFLDTKKLIDFLKPCAITLLALCFLNGACTLLNVKFEDKKFASNKKLEFKAQKTPKRDIYIFLLDAYAGQKTLSHLGFDNSNFTNSLKNRGFQVYNNMESNYNKTVLSLSSFLNADYIENIPFKTPAKAVSNSAFFKLAKKSGYKIYYINSWTMDFVITEGTIDEAYNSTKSASDDITELFIGKTLLMPPPKRQMKKRQKIFKQILAKAEDLIEQDDPKRLIFAHFLMPHPPYIFDENGNELPTKKVYDTNTTEPKGTVIKPESYIGFLKYANKTTLDFIDKIFAKNKEKPIIIVMGDHGARVVDYYPYEAEYLKEAEKNYKYYFNTFLAYYNPDIEWKNEVKTCEKSLINFSRELFNNIFETGLKPAEDKHFYIYSEAINFKDVKSIEAKY